MNEIKDKIIFNYNLSEFNFVINETDDKSEFDKLLIKKWEYAQNNNILRYKLSIKKYKILEGKYKFLMQLNLDRAQNRRTPENITSLKAQFDPNRFNFTKIRDEEILFDLSDGDGNNVIAVNVSPIEYGHCLFLSDRLKCLPQVVTKSSLRQIIELFLLSRSPYLRAVFNGLCAYASVNHLHWHIYYLKHKMLLEEIKLESLTEHVYILKDYPARGFCIKLSSFSNNLDDFVSKVFLIINWMQNNSIAHNVAITRARSLDRDQNGKIYDDVRVYIWARKMATGIKDTSGFIPAVCELFGHLSIRTEEAYESLTEDQVIKCLEDAICPFDFVCSKLKELLIN
ncbi:GDP-D-glucose phosphorylase 1 [Microplitis demolitor]|uniref:GDP-D-glucose phosphorylase 1 n=1 Tax=Microplitis demolitor TaxID=69319 RepID=UPI0004CCEC48|nr:GDP-D-glucose phosphorylase 1 [Microplitis demolitor]